MGPGSRNKRLRAQGPEAKGPGAGPLGPRAGPLGPGRGPGALAQSPGAPQPREGQVEGKPPGGPGPWARAQGAGPTLGPKGQDPGHWDLHFWTLGPLLGPRALLFPYYSRCGEISKACLSSKFLGRGEPNFALPGLPKSQAGGHGGEAAGGGSTERDRAREGSPTDEGAQSSLTSNDPPPGT